MPKHATDIADIERCFDVMVELRPHLLRESFVALVRQLMADGYRLAYLEDAGAVVAVAGYRIAHNLFLGKHLYVDDLVTAAHARSRGHGGRLLAQLRDVARASQCSHLHLDSGTQRQDAHRFYFREGMAITCFHFGEDLTNRE